MQPTDLLPLQTSGQCRIPILIGISAYGTLISFYRLKKATSGGPLPKIHPRAVRETKDGRVCNTVSELQWSIDILTKGGKEEFERRMDWIARASEKLAAGVSIDEASTEVSGADDMWEANSGDEDTASEGDASVAELATLTSGTPSPRDFSVSNSSESVKSDPAAP
jgi:hypothetical protein